MAFRSRFPPGSNYLFSLDKIDDNRLQSFYVLKSNWNHSILKAKFHIFEKIKNFNFGFAAYFTTFPIKAINFYLRCSVRTQDFIVDVLNTLFITGLLFLHEYLYSVFIYFVLAPVAAFILLIILYYAISLCLQCRANSQSNSTVYPSLSSVGWEREKKVMDTAAPESVSEHSSPAIVERATSIGGRGRKPAHGTINTQSDSSPRLLEKSPTKLNDIYIEDISSKDTDSSRPPVDRSANNSSSSNFNRA